MERVNTLFAAATLLFASTVAVRAEDPATQIIGVWKVISNSNKELATGKVNYPLGQNPVGYTQKRKIAFSGNKLTVTSEPTKLSEGQEVVFEVVFERIE